MGKRGRKAFLDEEMLWKFLMERSDIRWMITVNQCELAEKLGVRHTTVSDAIHRLLRQGLLVEKEVLKLNKKRYKVKPPHAPEVQALVRKQVQPAWG